MKISEESFVLGDSLPYLVARVGKLVEETFEPQLKANGLTIEMWRVLIVLQQDGEHNLVELSRATSIKPSTLSRLVGRMIEADLISRRRSTADNRTVEVRIRKAGARKVQRLVPRANEIQNLVTEPFRSNEMPVLKEYLNRIYRRLTQRNSVAVNLARVETFFAGQYICKIINCICKYLLIYSHLRIASHAYLAGGNP